MREDMCHVIVERPRWGHSASNETVAHERTWALRADCPKTLELPKTGPMRPRKGTPKRLNENLAPLRRFLAKQVGRRWDDVYSELRARIAPSSTVQMHIQQHVYDTICPNVELVDGRVYEVPHRWHRRPLYADRDTLYVDPRTGVLRRPKERAPVTPVPPPPRRGPAGTNTVYVELDGSWFVASLRPLRCPPEFGEFDVVLRTRTSLGNAAERRRLYGDEKWVAVSKRQLSKREIRQARLR